jgi:hypothetical protein
MPFLALYDLRPSLQFSSFLHISRLAPLLLCRSMYISLIFIFDSLVITMYYKNPNPSIVMSSMHAHMFLFHLVVSFLLHASLPKIAFLYYSACLQSAPNTNMWLILSHLNLVCFVDLSCDLLKLLCELCFLYLGLHGLLLEWTQ